MEIEQLLKQCRFSRRYQGYHALKECVDIVLVNEDELLYMTGVYTEAAKRCRVSWMHVERNIRTMLENAWKNGGKEVLEDVAGCVLLQKPTVSELIEILCCYIKEHS